MPVFGRLLGWIPYFETYLSIIQVLKTDLIVQITQIITEGDSGIKQNLYHKLTEEQLMKLYIDEKALKGLEQMEERVEDILK